MKRLVIAGGVAVWFLIIGLAIAEESRGQKQGNPRIIPISEIFTTSPQHGMPSVRQAFEQRNPQSPGTADDYLRKALRGLNGSSNVFLVEATTIYEAVSASYGILTERGLRILLRR
jgi:hypothetical protein